MSATRNSTTCRAAFASPGADLPASWLVLADAHLFRRGTRSAIAIRAGDAGGAVGRLAVLPARLGVDGEPQPEHVHPDRAGHRRGVWVQRGGGVGPGLFPASFRGTAAARRVLRAGGGDHDPGAAGPGAGIAGARHAPRARFAPCWAWRRRRRGWSMPTAARPTCRWTACMPATACASVPARKCRWTASVVEGQSAVDESMVTGRADAGREGDGRPASPEAR